MLYLSNDRGNMDGYAVNTKILIVFKGDNERAYWLYDVHEDGSIDVIDRQGNAYHVMPDGTREKLNRCDILEQSMSILKEIAIQYRKNGGAPDDQYNLHRFRNRVLADRLSEKLKALKIKNHLYVSVFGTAIAVDWYRTTFDTFFSAIIQYHIADTF